MYNRIFYKEKFPFLLEHINVNKNNKDIQNLLYLSHDKLNSEYENLDMLNEIHRLKSLGIQEDNILQNEYSLYEENNEELSIHKSITNKNNFNLWDA